MYYRYFLFLFTVIDCRFGAEVENKRHMWTSLQDFISIHTYAATC